MPEYRIGSLLVDGPHEKHAWPLLSETAQVLDEPVRAGVSRPHEPFRVSELDGWDGIRCTLILNPWRTYIGPGQLAVGFFVLVFHNLQSFWEQRDPKPQTFYL